MKRGVLVMAYGSPNAIEDIEPFYTDIRRGRKPSPELLEELTGRYMAIGGVSPLLKVTNAQAQSLYDNLITKYPVYVGMRHWEPWIKDAVTQMKQDGIEEAVGIVMAPHFSSMSIAAYIKKVEDALLVNEANIKFHFIKSWHNNPLYINALANKVKGAQALFNDEEKRDLTYVFTAHSLPERILLDNDPYKNQLLETCQLLADELHITNWQFAFQSAGRTEEKWLGPDLLESINEMTQKGVKSLLVCSVGFITDHLEVLYDIDIEAKNHVAQYGMHLERASSLNADPLLGKLFADLITNTFNEA
jgi:protoporphyrin/coproporphyrin ferrochelatase